MYTIFKCFETFIKCDSLFNAIVNFNQNYGIRLVFVASKIRIKKFKYFDEATVCADFLLWLDYLYLSCIYTSISGIVISYSSVALLLLELASVNFVIVNKIIEDWNSRKLSNKYDNEIIKSCHIQDFVPGLLRDTGTPLWIR